MKLKHLVLPLVATVVVCLNGSARAQENEYKSLIVTPPNIAERDQLYVLPSRNVIVGGDCSSEYFFRQDNLRPIETRLEPGCRKFFVSERGGIVVKAFNDGLTINSLETGKRMSVINGAASYGIVSSGILLDNDQSLLTAYSYQPAVYRVDLSAQRSWKRIGAHRSGLNVEGFSVNALSTVGISVARYPSKPTEVIIWDLANDRKMSTYAAETAALSKDGRLFALAVKTGEKKNRIELRRVADGQLISQLAVNGMDTEHYGKDLRYGAFDFLDDAGSLGFVTEVDSPDANLEFRVWKAGATASQPRFKITAGFLDDIISIRPDLGYLYILKASGVHRFALETGKAATENPLTESFDPEAVTLSDDAQVLALAEGRTIAIVDTTSGGVIKMHEAPAPVSDYCTDDCRIKHLAFIPGTRTLIYADDDGAINALDIAMGTQRSIYTTKSNHNKSIDAFALSANGRYLAFAQNDVAYVMDVATKATAVRFAISKAGGMYGIILAFVDDDRRLLVGGRELDIFDIGQQSKVLNYKSTIFVDRTRYYNASVKYVVPTKFLNDSWIIGIAGNPGGQMLAYRDGRIVRHFGSGRPSTTYLTGQAGTAVDFSSTQMIVGRGTDIRVTDASFQTWERVSSHPAEVKFLARLKSGNLLSVSKNGEIRIGLGASSTDLVRTSLYGDGHWVAVSPEGFFAGTDQALRKLYIRSGGSDIVPLDNLYQSLYRPDLIREKLAGDPQGKVGLASTRLDLAKIIESGAAPKVSISLAEGGQVSTTDEVEIRAKIVAQGGGIGKVEWRVNGITLGLESRGFERLTGGSQETVVSRKLSLDPGENKIEVVAYNARDLIASDAAQTLIRWDGQNTAAPPTLYVLAVGVNDYFDGRLRLSYAVPDAKALAEGLVKTGAGLYSDVHVTRVLDADVTREKLDKAFTEIGSKVKARDVFVFFLAGHGKTKNGKYYFLPRDFRYEDENSIERSGINQDQFQGWFSKVAARKSILLYDTCESGSLTSANATRGDIDERLGALNRMTRATGRTFLVATTDDAPAIEGYKGHGVFTYALLDAMERGDVNGNGLIEISELADYVDAKVPDYSFEAFKMRQVPQRNIVGSNFALANRGAVLGAVGADQKAAAPFPTKATHVVISNVISRSEADDAAQTTMSLSPGMQVRVIETTGGWALVAREGRRIGYVQQRDLVALQ